MEAESVSIGLVTELIEMQRILQEESDEHVLLSAALDVVYDDLDVVRPQGTRSLVAYAVGITMWVR